MLKVWVDDWQMACCGTSFSVGARVTWTVSSELDTEWLTTVVGPEIAASITYVEDHHFDAETVPVTISATVVAIEAVQCDFAVRPGQNATWPVEGSDMRVPVTYAPRWVPDEEPRRFVGWLVDLDHDYLIPTDPQALPRGHHSASVSCTELMTRCDHGPNPHPQLLDLPRRLRYRGGAGIRDALRACRPSPARVDVRHPLRPPDPGS